YYATFAEIVETESERVFLSNIKSVCDVVYFSLGFALLPAFVSMGINVRVIALIFLPLAATMLIPMFLIKEESTVDGVKHPEGSVPEQRVGFAKSLIYSFKNKHFIFWMCTHAVLNTGLQLFLGGINEYFSTTNLNMTFVMASSFAPVPLTLLLYNKLVKKKGLKFAYQYVILMFALGMSLMYVCRMLDESIMLYVAILCGIIVSFAIGAFFSVSYTVPSHLAAEENKKSGICASSMYFAVQGLFEGISAGTATGLILVYLKTAELVRYMTLIVTGFCLIAFILAFLLPKSIALIGKQKSDNE
ncbi:MAG: MFS transporter, partial [Clostridia bacterium]|nr:MFS transporter [Clostridia bacterium]